MLPAVAPVPALRVTSPATPEALLPEATVTVPVELSEEPVAILTEPLEVSTESVVITSTLEEPTRLSAPATLSEAAFAPADKVIEPPSLPDPALISTEPAWVSRLSVDPASIEIIPGSPDTVEPVEILTSPDFSVAEGVETVMEPDFPVVEDPPERIKFPPVPVSDEPPITCVDPPTTPERP